jgi:hypothetical protein
MPKIVSQNRNFFWRLSVLMNKKRILAFGNPVYDIISTPAFRRSDRILSGCSTNACLAATKLGEDAMLVGTVGADFASQLGKELTRYNIVHNLLLCIRGALVWCMTNVVIVNYLSLVSRIQLHLL